MPRSRFTIGLLSVATILAIAYACFYPTVSNVEHRPLPPAVLKLRRIKNALDYHLYEHNTLPFDERGYRHALYKLHLWVDASDFQLFDRSDVPPPRWDHSTQSLIGGDTVYLNQRVTQRFPCRVIFFATSPGDGTFAWVAHSASGPWSATFPASPTLALLGSFLTEDNFYVRGLDTFHDFTLTHNRVSSQTWVNGNVVSSKGSQIQIAYRYKSGRLSDCTVTLEGGKITETFQTDEMGQIVSVQRSPRNWRELLNETSR